MSYCDLVSYFVLTSPRAFCLVGGTNKDHFVVSVKGLEKLGYPSPLNVMWLVYCESTTLTTQKSRSE